MVDNTPEVFGLSGHSQFWVFPPTSIATEVSVQLPNIGTVTVTVSIFTTGKT
jgi:hypothetical protein